MDKLILGGHEFDSRLLIGTGKFGSNDILPEVIKASNSEIITMAIRRVDLDNPNENILTYIPKEMTILPNTSGATNAEEAVISLKTEPGSYNSETDLLDHIL